MPLNKPQLLVLNQVNFPDNTQQLITPVLLRDFNTQMINSMELTQSMDEYANLGTANLFYGGNQSIAKEYKLVANGVYWNDSTVGYNNLEIINSATGNLDLAALNGGVRIVSSSLNITNGTFTASLAEGFTYVGNGSNRTTLVATSSFGTPIPAGTISSSAQITDLGFVSSSVTASSLITASFSGNTLTFTKGDSSTFGVVIPDISGSTINTGSFATTGSNTFIGNQNISGAINFPNGTQLYGDAGNETVFNSPTRSLRISSAVNTQFYAGQTLEMSGSADVNIIGNNNVLLKAINSGITITGSNVVMDGWFGGVNIKGSSVVMQGFTYPTTDGTNGQVLTTNGSKTLSFTTVSGSTINTGSFATTGSNVFIGNETFSNTDGNGTTLTPFSGSLVLTVKGGLASSSSLQNNLFISASATGQTNITNIIFNTLTQQNPSGSVIVSGSQNIFNIPGTNQPGFVRKITTGNISLAGSTLPTYTSSMNDVPIQYTNNITLNGSAIFRGPISSSQYVFNGNNLMGGASLGDATESMVSASAGINFQGNHFLAAKTFRAAKTQLSSSVNATSNLFGNAGHTTNLASSSVTYTANSFYGTGIGFVNAYFAPSAVANNQRVEVLYNLVGGQSAQLYTSGSNTTTTFNRQINNNFIGGNFCIISASANGDNSSLLTNIIYGNYLNVNGNSPYSSGVATVGHGSAFIGRYNANNGTRANSAETIFAVGTGISNGVRKTGFLIDSGSNTFVEGTLNVSGSTSFNGAVNITGSLTSSLTLGYVWVGGAGNVSTLVATSSFAGGSVPAGTVSSSAQITALGFVSSSVTASSLITASVNLNTITFTKGDSSTFAITVNTGSGGGGSVPAGTVSSSAQILGYNIFATTGSNTFTGGQTIRSGGGLELAPNVGGGGSDNFINIKSENQSTMYLQNTVVSSGYQSGSVLQLSAGSGSNGYGFSGSATFQMDAKYNGYASAIKVQAINGVGSALIGLGERISFAAKEGFPYTPSNSFTVDATSIELSGSLKLNTGTSGPAGTAVLDGANPSSVTVSNSLVTAGSLIYLTKQTLTNSHMVAVSSKGSGTFTITSNGNGDTDTVAYLIINPI